MPTSSRFLFSKTTMPVEPNYRVLRTTTHLRNINKSCRGRCPHRPVFCFASVRRDDVGIVPYNKNKNHTRCIRTLHKIQQFKQNQYPQHKKTAQNIRFKRFYYIIKQIYPYNGKIISSYLQLRQRSFLLSFQDPRLFQI